MRTGCLIFALVSVGCSGDLVVVDDDDVTPPTGGAMGATGGTSDTGGGGGVGATGPVGGNGGSGGVGGLGGDGGEGGEPSTLPDCRVLREASEPLLIEDGHDGFLVPVNATDLAAVYRAETEGPGLWETRSRILPGAFGSWPPSVTDPIWHAEYPPDPLTRQVRDGGDFAVFLSGGWGWIVSSFDEEGALMSTPPYDRDEPILEPAPGEGIFWSDGDVLTYFPSLDAELPTATIPIPPELGAIGTTGTNDLGDLVMEGSETFFHLRAGSFLQGAPIPAIDGWQRSIIPRTGGFWFGGLGDAVELYAIGNDGSVAAGYRPLGDQAFGHRLAMARWRDGVAIAVSGQESGGFTVAVTDGVRSTSLTLSGAETNYCHNGISVAASPSGDSVYVGYLHCPMDGINFAVRRFDCVAE